MNVKKDLTKLDEIHEQCLDPVSKEMVMGEVFAKSGMFPDIKNAAQGYVKILAGKELGLSPIQALNSFYFVNGRLGIMSQAVSALVKKSGKYDYQIVSHTDQECVIEFYLVNGDKKKIGTSKFDMKAAAKAGIINKDVWKNYPMNLLFARAMMNGVRFFCPDAISSLTYSVEELRDLEPEKKQEVITMSQEGEVKKDE